ncbi:hypothetical protein H1R20_g3893, partial [Candolleomyces eurysporus]
MAWSSSELWSKIKIDFEYCEYEPVPTFKPIDMELLTEWMLRTGTGRLLTLTIHCSLYTIRTPRICPFIEPVQLLRFICDHRHRWEHLNLCIPRGWFKRLNNFDFPKLKGIDFTAFDSSPARPLNLIAIDLGQWRARSLQSVHMRGIQVQSLDTPWTQLRCISFTEMQPEPFFNVLPHFTNAEEIRVSLLWGCYRPVLSWITRTQLVVFPALEHLGIRCEFATFATALLGKLVARHLKCLTLSLFKEDMDILPAAIKAFVGQSNLKKLTLEVDYDNSNATMPQATEMWQKLVDQALIPVALKG